jgi:hypothetical protein
VMILLTGAEKRRQRGVWIASIGVRKHGGGVAGVGEHKEKLNRPAAEDYSSVGRGSGWNLRASATLRPDSSRALFPRISGRAFENFTDAV